MLENLINLFNSKEGFLNINIGNVFNISKFYSSKGIDPGKNYIPMDNQLKINRTCSILILKTKPRRYWHG